MLTAQEVAVLFRVNVKTVRRWVRAKRLRAVITPGGRYRFRESDVRAAWHQGGNT